MLKYLLGTENGIEGKDLGQQGGVKPQEVEWREQAAKRQAGSGGDARFPHVEPACTLTWCCRPPHRYERRRHEHLRHARSFHPLSAAVDPARVRKATGRFTRASPRPSPRCVGHLGRETDVVTLPIQHDSPPNWRCLRVQDWKKGECDLIRAKLRRTSSRWNAITSHLRALHLLGPLLDKLGNGGKGIAGTQTEVDFLKQLNYVKADGPAAGGRRLRAQ